MNVLRSYLLDLRRSTASAFRSLSLISASVLLLKRKSKHRLNRLVYQDQFQTLNQELAEHRISKAVYDAELSELEARAVEETATPNVAYRNPSWVKPVSIFLCLLVPLTAVFLYFSWANPSLVTYKGTPEAQAAAHPADRIGQLKTFLKESPRAVRAWLALADEFGREGQYKEAVNAMNEAFHVSPNGVAKTADYRVQRAVFALETSDPMLRSQAVSDLEQAVKLEPSNIRALGARRNRGLPKWSIQQSSRILAGAAASGRLRILRRIRGSWMPSRMPRTVLKWNFRF